MNQLITQIQSDTKQALLNKEKAKLSTLRLLIADLEKEKVTLKLSTVSELKDEQVTTVINRSIKKLDKEIESYIAVGRGVESQESEKKVLQSYLPEQLSEAEIREIVKHSFDLVTRGEIKNPMKYLSQRLKGRADMKLVSEIAKELHG